MELESESVKELNEDDLANLVIVTEVEGGSVVFISKPTTVFRTRSTCGTCAWSQVARVSLGGSTELSTEGSMAVLGEVQVLGDLSRLANELDGVHRRGELTL